MSDMRTEWSCEPVEGGVIVTLKWQRGDDDPLAARMKIDQPLIDLVPPGGMFGYLIVNASAYLPAMRRKWIERYGE